MKRSLIITAMLFLIFGLTSHAQSWRNNTEIHTTHSDQYSNNDYGHHANGYSYNSNRQHRHRQLSRKDRHKLNRLQKELAIVKRNALYDGYLSRRERRRIQDIKYDIDRILGNHNYRNRNIRYNRNGCR